MKKMFILLFFIALAASVYAYNKGTANFNVSYELITVPIAGVVYTPDSLGYHHLPINITFSGALALSSLSLNIKNITWIKSQILGKDSLENMTINILSNETYENKAWIPNITCNDSQKSGIFNQSNCTDSGYYTYFDSWRYVWIPLTSLSIPKNKWFVIDIIGYSKPGMEFSSLDIVPSLFGFSMPELAWWNTNYANCKNITLTESRGYNRTFEPIKINLTGLTKQADDDDVRIVNAACNMDGTEQPRDVLSNTSTSAYVIFLANYTTTDSDHKYSVYYNYGSATTPSYSSNLAFTGNSTDLYVRVSSSYNFTWDDNSPGDTGILRLFYANETVSIAPSHFDDFNVVAAATLTPKFNGTLISMFNVTSSLRTETVECYAQNFYCRMIYYAAPSTNDWYSIYMGAASNTIYWVDNTTTNSWNMCQSATSCMGIAYAWNDTTNRIPITMLNITNFTNTNKLRSDGSGWYAESPSYDVFNNITGEFFTIFNMLWANSNNTFERLKNPLSTALGSEQTCGAGTTITLIREWLNNAENNLNLNYGYSNLNLTGLINVTGIPLNILQNGTNISSGYTRIETTRNGLGAGYYNFTANFSGNATYAASSQAYFLTVSPQPSSCSLSFSPASNISYETTMKAVCSCNNSVGTTNLYRNTTQINAWNDTNVIYGAGTYIYACNITSNQNYSSAASEGTFVVSKLNAALQASPDSAFSYTGIATNQYCTGASTISSSTLYRNGTSITNNTGFLFPSANPSGRGWNMTCNIADSANYTNWYATALFNVSQAIPNTSLNFNTSSPSIIGTVINVSCYAPDTSSLAYPYGLWNVSTNISNPYIWNTAGYSAGTYTYNCNSSVTQNYTYLLVSNSMTLTSTGALVITAVYDEENTTKSLTFNVEIYNTTYSTTSSGITSYNNNAVRGDLTIVISATGYGTRTYYATVPPSGTYTMSGYLLNSSSGNSKVFYVKNYYEKLLPNVLFNITKLIGGNWTSMAMGLTSDLGYSVFFIEPNGNYKFTLTKASYDTKNFTLVPIYDTYTIYMTSPDVTMMDATRYNASYGNILYNLWLDRSTANSSIRFDYNDMMNQTTNISFRIYNSTNHSIYWVFNTSNPASFNKQLPVPNTTYLAVVNVTHNVFGQITIVRWFDTSSTILPKPFSVNLFNQVMSVIAIIMVALMFGAVEGATGGIIVMIVATFFVYWGWYSVSAVILGIAWFYAILNKMMHRKVVR